ncbi:VOC family protein [Granulicella tundricola]|uniref:Glyoxalase/bleomycin resistance protein/dioxygenase n=1 Tax=Granulicella tundricola (strain ATCC BAA-1859 / DSM 23138 / MP5ACTX9) TaxID=1198114 RepID=E8WWU7_GRATM|nr:VOC family protein [Granulicella tundricola]ADW67425.1 Glyoxalase/bleomycin resistance protein/dioxygenase [Granulicella tundricola MP5ACTX9]
MRFLALTALALLTLPTLAQPPRPKITGIAYVRFYESDLPAAKAFYAQRLGLPEIDTPQGAVFTVGARQSIRIAPLPSPAPPNRLAEAAFLTPDIPGMKRFLTAHHIPFEPISPAEIRLKDPEGNPIGFLSEQHLPAPAHVATTQVASATRIIHAGWGVHSAAAEDAFFRDLLGFRPYWHGGMTPDKTDWISLQVPDGQDWIEYMLEYSPTDSLKKLGVLDHVSLGVVKITDVTDRLVANGWTDPDTRKSQIGRDGKWQLNVFDPDQSRIEFMEYTPTRKPCCSDFTASNPTP